MILIGYLEVKVLVQRKATLQTVQHDMEVQQDEQVPVQALIILLIGQLGQRVRGTLDHQVFLASLQKDTIEPTLAKAELLRGNPA